MSRSSCKAGGAPLSRPRTRWSTHMRETRSLASPDPRTSPQLCSRVWRPERLISDQDHQISVDELYDYIFDRVRGLHCQIKRRPNRAPSRDRCMSRAATTPEASSLRSSMSALSCSPRKLRSREPGSTRLMSWTAC